MLGWSVGEWVCAEFRFSFNRRVGMGGKSKLSPHGAEKVIGNFGSVRF